MGCASTSQRGRPRPNPIRVTQVQQTKIPTQRTSVQQDQDLAREIGASGVSSKGHTSHRVEPVQTPKKNNKLGMFIVQDPEQGDQMLAIKPWQGALRAPTAPPAFNNNLPAVQLEAQYVYGYRCFDSRQNIFYTKNQNQIVYMTAGVGIVLNTINNTQKIYGAGSAKGTPGHDDDITALALHPGRQIVATGEVGKNPKICVWNVNDTNNSIIEFRQGRDTRAVTTLGFNFTGELLAGADLHNDHNVRIWTWRDGNCIYQEKGGPDRILDLSWAVDENRFCTVGVKHIYFWTEIEERFSKKKGILGLGNTGATLTCVEWKQDGTAVVGSITGQLLIFKGNSVTNSIDIHGKNQAVHSLRIVNDIVYSGGKDNTVKKLNAQINKVVETIDVGAFPRAIDAYDNKIVIGTRDGSILEYQNSNTKVLMKSHSDGQVWGLTLAPDNPNIFVTVGDDNSLIVWNSQKRMCIKKQILQTQPGQPRKPGQGASTLASNTPLQQARAVCINPSNLHIAVGHNDGHVTIFQSYLSLKQIKKMKDAAQWIECMAFSPDGSKLAVGSHDNKIYIYSSPNYIRIRTLVGHSSFIIALDWSQDSQVLHTNCGAYELLFWNASTGEQLKSGATAYRDEVWATWTAKIGWPVQGIYEGVIDMTHVNTVDRSPDKQFFAIGNDFGDVVLFNNPNGQKAKGRGYKGHSEHVTNVKWGISRLISAGGYDQTLIQWRVK